MNIRDKYHPPFWALNGHLETVIPALWRMVPEVDYRRHDLELNDGDHLRLNWLERGSGKLVVIIPGLVSDSDQGYVKSMSFFLYQSGFDVLVQDHRGGLPEPNRLYRSYHSGNTEDLNEILNLPAVQQYKYIMGLGFSLGGNILLKYLGEKGSKSRIEKAAAVSAPLDLSLSSRYLEKWSNRVYQERFLRKLKKQLKTKLMKFPDYLPLSKVEDCRTIKEIDDIYTAPAHGFKNAEDYYSRCSSAIFIPEIKVPSLVISALNDPIIPLTEGLQKMLYRNSMLKPLITRRGGHVGWPETKLKGINWYEGMVLKYFTEV